MDSSGSRRIIPLFCLTYTLPASILVCMDALTQYFKVLYLWLRRAGRLMMALLPSPLPIGMTEFDAWAASIIRLTTLPDNDSVRNALASMVIQLKPTDAYKPKIFFALTLHTVAAKQVAGAKFQEFNNAQKARLKAEQEAAASASQPKSAEATAPTVASNVSPIKT